MDAQVPGGFDIQGADAVVDDALSPTSVLTSPIPLNEHFVVGESHQRETTLLPSIVVTERQALANFFQVGSTAVGERSLVHLAPTTNKVPLATFFQVGATDTIKRELTPTTVSTPSQHLSAFFINRASASAEMHLIGLAPPTPPESLIGFAIVGADAVMTRSLADLGSGDPLPEGSLTVSIDGPDAAVWLLTVRDGPALVARAYLVSGGSVTIPVPAAVSLMVSESGPHTEATSYECSDGVVGRSVDVNLTPGSTLECSFTNRETPPDPVPEFDWTVPARR